MSQKLTSKIQPPQIAALLALSAKIGRDPLLVQGSSGNTSVKLDGKMWIKASGKWLADAEQHEILVPVDLEEAAQAVEQGTEITGSCTGVSGIGLRASIETAMHAVLPHSVAVHVHSVSAIAWAVRQDGASRMADRLSGLRWRWIRYVSSGLPLAREIQACVSSSPGTNVFVLGNHGLVICGDTCHACDNLLSEVERRLAVPPRYSPEPDFALLRQLTNGSHWRLPESESVHTLANDAVSRHIVSAGVLYPCQAIFLGGRAKVVPPHQRDLAGCFAKTENLPPFLIVAGAGVLVSDRITRPERQMLIGLSEVAARIDSSAPIRYLSAAELTGVMTEDTQRYRQLAAINNAAVASA